MLMGGARDIAQSDLKLVPTGSTQRQRQSHVLEVPQLGTPEASTAWLEGVGCMSIGEG